MTEEYHVFEKEIGYRLKKYLEECTKNPAAKEKYDLEKKRTSGFERSLRNPKRKTNS